MTEPYVFISYSHPDSAFVGRLADSLRASGVRSWTAMEIPGGADWRKELEKGLANASALIYVASKNSGESKWMGAELQAFLRARKRVLPIVVDNEGASHLQLRLREFQSADFRGEFEVAFSKLLEGLRFLQQSQPIERPNLKSKGYVFISYAEEDASFVEELKVFLGQRGYAYWDFRESERDYDIDYSLELEGVIKDAAGTLSVVSRNWKQSQISLQEFHFSREVGTPVFLLKAGDAGPTLALLGLTYIDFTREHGKGFEKLAKELKRKGL